jgi:protein-S-isoprenylcysteine O-methyltransferase Ste14
MRSLELKVPPPLVALVIAVLMWLLSRIAPSLGLTIPAHRVAGVLFVAAGLIVGFSGVATFRRARTTVNPMKPQASSSLVTWGIYSVTRNPMYLGGLVILTGWAIYLSNPFPFLLVPVYILYIDRFQIIPEERALTSLFGGEFAAYQSRVRRWI